MKNLITIIGTVAIISGVFVWDQLLQAAVCDDGYDYSNEASQIGFIKMGGLKTMSQNRRNCRPNRGALEAIAELNGYTNHKVKFNGEDWRESLKDSKEKGLVKTKYDNAAGYLECWDGTNESNVSNSSGFIMRVEGQNYLLSAGHPYCDKLRQTTGIQPRYQHCDFFQGRDIYNSTKVAVKIDSDNFRLGEESCAKTRVQDLRGNDFAISKLGELKEKNLTSLAIAQIDNDTLLRDFPHGLQVEFIAFNAETMNMGVTRKKCFVYPKVVDESRPGRRPIHENNENFLLHSCSGNGGSSGGILVAKLKNEKGQLYEAVVGINVGRGRNPQVYAYGSYPDAKMEKQPYSIYDNTGVAMSFNNENFLEKFNELHDSQSEEKKPVTSTGI